MCQTVKDFPETNSAERHNETSESAAEQAGESSSSWSSCEVLPLDEGGDDVGAVGPENAMKTPEKLPLIEKAEQETIHKDNRNINTHHPNSWASGSVLSVSPLSTGSSEVFLPSGPSDLQVPVTSSETRSNYSVVAKLRQQMAQQKVEYQRKIER